MRFATLLVFIQCSLFAPLASAQTSHYRADWTLALRAGDDQATVTLELEDGRAVHEVRFRYDPARFSDFATTGGELEVTDERVVWQPSRENARLSFRARITRERANQNQDKSYDALMTDDWALFRGDRIVPRMRVTARAGAESDAYLHFDVPADWGVNTGWPLEQASADGNSYRLDDPDRNFDRPRGWMMVGKLGARRDHVGSTYFSVVAPLGSQVDRMGWLTLVSLVYPEVEKAFGKVPEKLLLVSGDDPLWRGGLSGPNSFFFHSSRKAISENGTSPLLHEITHVITRISGTYNDDWIAEGLAEYYGIEFLHRAGGISDAKRAEILADLAAWGAEAPQLRVQQSSGPVTARAVVVFDQLDKEIAELTAGAANLDAVMRLLMEERRVGLQDVQQAFTAVTGARSQVLDTVEGS